MSLVSALLVQPGSVYAGSWGQWWCQWAVIGWYLPSDGGTLDGRGCAQWWQTSNPNENWWNVWGDTYVTYSYAVNTYAAGYDTCAGGPYVYRMAGSATVYNTGYGTSGNPAFGYYDQYCTSGHGYAVRYIGQRKATSSSPWEGPGARWVYW